MWTVYFRSYWSYKNAFIWTKYVINKYILLVRVICENYRLRGDSGEANFLSRLTNRIYLFNSTEYLTVSKTVVYKQHGRMEPFQWGFFTIQISSVKFKITADNVVCHFSLLYHWLEEATRVIRNYIRDVINDLKKGFFSRAWYLANTMLYEFPRTYTPPMRKKRKKIRIGKKYPFYQPIRRQHSYIRWNSF